MRLPSNAPRRSEEIRRRRLLDSHASRQTTQKKGGATILGRSVSRPEPRRKTAAVHTPPPVMARGFSTARTRPSGHGARGGRRVHRLTLAQGAEMSLPAVPHIGFSWRVASLILLAFVGAALYYLWTSPAFRVENAQVSGLRRITRGDVTRELGLRDRPVFTLDGAELQDELLKAFPEFSNAQVMIDLPNTLLITVTERVPVLVWKQAGATILVDNEGMTFQARDSVALGGLPVVEAAGDPPKVADLTQMTTLEKKIAEQNGQEVPDEVFPAGVPVGDRTDSLLQQIKPTRMFSQDMVNMIVHFSSYIPPGATMIYDPVHGFGWMDNRGWPVMMGDLSNLAVKLSEYQVIIEKIKASGGTPELISVELVHAPYYRLKKQQGDEE